MKIFCCYTPAHAVLFERYFRPSLPAGLELHARCVELEGAGDFFSREYLACIQRKIELVIETLRTNRGEVLIWSDVDIIFLQPVAAPFLAELESSGCDILFQREGPRTNDINGGLYVLRASEALEQFFRMVLAELVARPGVDDQFVFNERLSAGPGFSWGYLPMTCYARTHGWPPRPDILLYHANETRAPDSVGKKIRQFEELFWIRRHGRLALWWSCLTKIPKRLRRWVKDFLEKKTGR